MLPNIGTFSLQRVIFGRWVVMYRDCDKSWTLRHACGVKDSQVDLVNDLVATKKISILFGSRMRRGRRRHFETVKKCPKCKEHILPGLIMFIYLRGMLNEKDSFGKTGARSTHR